MNTAHERLTRTTFSLPLGEVHALVGGAVNARPLLFLHGFPDHPPTALLISRTLHKTRSNNIMTSCLIHRAKRAYLLA
jgi:hypothetical protein